MQFQKLGLGRRMKFTFKARACRGPCQLDFLEINVAFAERMEGFVNGLFGREKHRQGPVEIAAATDPVEFSFTTDHFTDINTSSSGNTFEIYPNQPFAGTFRYGSNAPRPAVSDRARNAVGPQGLAVIATQHGNTTTESQLRKREARCNSPQRPFGVFFRAGSRGQLLRLFGKQRISAFVFCGQYCKGNLRL